MTPEVINMPRTAKGDLERLDEIMLVKNLKMHFPITKGLLKRQVGSVKAVDGVSFKIPRGQTLGLVGESGSGKSTIGHCLLNRYKITSGDIWFEGNNFKDVSAVSMRRMRKTLQMFLYCGISTTFWGFMFGSFFGDLVGVVATTFFGRPDIALGPLWFEPVKEPMRMLVFSMLLGIIHLFTGLAMKAYQYAKQTAWLDILYDVGFWYMLLVGLIVYGLSTEMLPSILQLSFILPASVGTVGIAAAAIGAVGIILTAGRESRNPVKRLLKGAYGLYGVTSYLSAVLS